MKTTLLPFASFFFLIASLTFDVAESALLQSNDSPIKVELRSTLETGFQLTRDGQPYRIHGAGGEGSLKLLAQYGGNSTRLWGVDENTMARLDEAHRIGLTVALGIWLEQPQSGFDYTDEKAVAQQFETVIAAVEKYKHHPAILVWGIGNEMEGFEGGDNGIIFQHVDALAKRIKEIDPNHPTMSVIADVSDQKIAAINEHCPNLDIVGINSYGGAPSLVERYKNGGGKKPFILTEFGPIGSWEVPKNSLGAIDELPSTAKVDSYLAAYNSIEENSDICVGSYAFLWGNKQEATTTWFGMLTADGMKTEAVDVMSEKWSGQTVENRCPKIKSLTLKANAVQPAAEIEIELSASDPEGQPINARWSLLGEASNYATGGQFQKTPPDFSKSILKSSVAGATIKAPTEPGLYRAYVQVDDGQHAAATANVVFQVIGQATVTDKEPTKLPFVVYDESENVFASSGWMGNSNAVNVTGDCTEQPKAGDVCMKCEYKSRSEWAGVVWQHPADDWGEKDGGLNFTGAKKITFWARGEKGNEAIKFGYGLLGRDKAFFDTSKKEMEVSLNKEWKQYSIDVNGADMRMIKTPFFWTVAAQGESLTFYLDRIVVE